MKLLNRIGRLFLFLLLLGSCAQDFIRKPDRFLKQETMVDIYYELAVLNSLRTITPAEMQSSGIQSMPYIYEKFGIDSTVLMQNTEYYISRPDVYAAIYDSVLARVRRNAARVDTLRTQREQQSDTLSPPGSGGPPRMGNQEVL
jgi:hypothetical protein